MAWSFRKRIKILPGLTINLGKRGVSATLGRPGLSVSVGKKGTYVNAGLLGTGLSTRTRIDKPVSTGRGGSRKSREDAGGAERPAAPEDEPGSPAAPGDAGSGTTGSVSLSKALPWLIAAGALFYAFFK